MVELQFNTPHKTIQTDWGGEGIRSFTPFLKRITT